MRKRSLQEEKEAKERENTEYWRRREIERHGSSGGYVKSETTDREAAHRASGQDSDSEPEQERQAPEPRHRDQGMFANVPEMTPEQRKALFKDFGPPGMGQDSIKNHH